MVSQKKTVVFRVDGSHAIGGGHISRCLTLAEELKRRKIDSVFCLKFSDNSMERNIRKKGFRVSRISPQMSFQQEVEAFFDLFRQSQARAAIFDGYHLSEKYLRLMTDRLPCVCVIDDLGENHFDSDILLNQNITANPAMYRGKVGRKTQLLLGPQYALLRDEFRRFSGFKRRIGDVKNILVTFGGADKYNFTLKTLKALNDLHRKVSLTVVFGPSHQHFEEVKRFVRGSPRGRIKILKNVKNMAQLMRRADLIISSGGSTSWEICAMGTPALQVIMAQNQAGIVKELCRRGITINLGWYRKVTEQIIAKQVLRLISDKKKRQAMSRLGRLLVDAQGAQRVAQVLCRKMGKGI